VPSFLTGVDPAALTFFDGDGPGVVLLELILDGALPKEGEGVEGDLFSLLTYRQPSAEPRG
jgi:hypothetical protein